MQVDRVGGSIQEYDDPSGNSAWLITLASTHPMDQDMMDRTLQFVLVELGIDTTWADVPPPDPEVVPSCSRASMLPFEGCSSPEE